MKIRIKFEKDGVMRYIGHLDIMRYFQKAMRRGEIDICYTTGFSPHQIMSFAAPLGVGHISFGEYFDIETKGTLTPLEIKEQLNTVMVPGVRIANVIELPEGAKNAMASVAAARYFVEPKDAVLSKPDFESKKDAFLNQTEILVTKQTKKQELTMDIKPHIYEWIVRDNGVEMLVDASSSGNIKPTLALEAYLNYIGETMDPIQYQITKIDTFIRDEQGVLKPLDQV